MTNKNTAREIKRGGKELETVSKKYSLLNWSVKNGVYFTEPW